MKTSSLGKLALAFTAAATLALPAVADAATYVSYLEYKNDAPNTKVATPFGKVTLTEVGLNSVDVVVTLFNPQVGFLNTGNKKDAGGNKSPFTFNLSGDYDVTVYNAVDQDFVDGGYGSFQNNNFGQYTNKIDCCKGKNGGANADPTDLHFLVTNTAVGGTLTFAGLGATFDSDGRLATQGAGPQFLSNSDGFWFSADVITTSGDTFNVAARDAFGPTGAVPEPATWAMMIVGFGGVGGLMRRRRTALA